MEMCWEYRKITKPKSIPKKKPPQIPAGYPFDPENFISQMEDVAAEYIGEEELQEIDTGNSDYLAGEAIAGAPPLFTPMQQWTPPNSMSFGNGFSISWADDMLRFSINGREVLSVNQEGTLTARQISAESITTESFTTIESSMEV